MNLKKLFFPRAYQYVEAQYPDRAELHRIKRSAHHIESLFFSRSDSQRLVILSHPYLIEAKDYFLRSGHVDLYNDMGFDVAIFDFNGFGKSDDIDLKIHEDLLTVVDYYTNGREYDIVLGHGLSMGASMLINACQEQSKIQKLIIENCLDTNFSYFKKRNIKLYRLLKAIDFVLPSINKRNAYYKEVATIDNSVDKVLYLYNDKDDLTTVEMGQVLNSNTEISSELHILSGHHLSAIDTDSINYKEKISSFITA